MANTSSTDRPSPAPVGGLYTLLLFVSIVLVLAVVILSAYLRLSGSGLGCAEWPVCYALIKVDANATESLAAAHLVPAWATLIHRLVATLLGVLIVGITVMAWRHRRQPGQHLPISLAVLALTVFLSVLGYKTPSPLLPWVTLSNLLGGMAMLAMLWWLGQRSVTSITVDQAARGLRPWALAGICLVFFQIALGGWVSANFAALACTDLPGCGVYPWIDGPWGASFDLSRTLSVIPAGNIVPGDSGHVIHMVHRTGSIFTALYIGWLGWRAAGLGSRYRGTGVTMLVFLGAQILLGVSVIAFNLPLGLVTAHNAVAALLLLSVVNLYHLLVPPKNK